MNSSPRWFVWLAVLTAPFLSPLSSAERPPEGRGLPFERLERLERRLEQLADQQEQVLRQLRSQAERMEQRASQFAERREQWLRQGGGPGPAPDMGPGRPMPPPPRLQPPPPVARHLKGLQDAIGLVFLVWLLCNLLLAIWIFTDIRKRGEGPAIFVALAMIAGVPAAIIYALVRIGDCQPAAPAPPPAANPA